MAAAQSPCGGLKNRVLHFKVKSTPLKDKIWKEKIQKNAQFSFLRRKGSFSSRNLPSKNSILFSSRRSAWSALKCNQDSEVFSEFSRTLCTLWPSKSMFLKGNLSIYKCFINVLCIFFSVLKKKYKMRPDLRWIFCWILPCAQPILLAWTDPR